MRKKIFFFLCLFSLVFFSCKSTPPIENIDKEQSEDFEMQNENQSNDVSKDDNITDDGLSDESVPDENGQDENSTSVEDEDGLGENDDTGDTGEFDSDTSPSKENENVEIDTEEKEADVDDDTMFDEPDLILTDDLEWFENEESATEDGSSGEVKGTDDENQNDDTDDDKTALLEELQQVVFDAQNLMAKVEDVLKKEIEYRGKKNVGEPYTSDSEIYTETETATATKTELAAASAMETATKTESATVPTVAGTAIPTETEAATETAAATTAKIPVESYSASSDEQNSTLLEESVYLDENPTFEIKVFREAQLKVGQNLVATYPGNDWIYLGEVDLSSGRTISPEIIDFTDKLNINDKTVFTLEAKKEGQVIIHFYKVDNVSSEFIDDYVLVKVEGFDANSPFQHSVVKIPDYEMDSYLLQDVSESKVSIDNSNSEIESDDENVDENEMDEFIAETIEEEPELVFAGDFSDDVQQTSASVQSSTSTNSADTSTTASYTVPSSVSTSTSSANTTASSTVQSSVSTSTNSASTVADTSTATLPIQTNSTQINSQLASADSPDTDELLSSARLYLENAEYEKAFSNLTRFIESSSKNLDEAYFLLGQTLEAKSPVRDIKRALYSYTYVVENFPESPFWEKSLEKEKYIKRLYFNIR